MLKSNTVFIFLFFIGVTIAIFFPSFLKGHIPFPGDFHIAWFEPWKSEYTQTNTLTIAHKPIADDIFRQLYPFKIYAINAFKQLTIPLWNPYNGAGMPHLATMHVGYFNPFNILFFIFSEKLAWLIYVIIQPFFVGLFMYLYSRKIGISLIGSIFSSISLMMSGFVITRTIYGDYDYALIGFLGLLFCIESFILHKSKYVVLIPAAVFLIITSTQPQIISYMLLFIAIYIVIRCYIKLKSEFFSYTFTIFTTIGIGIGLSMIQLLPTIELFKYSAIDASSSKFIIDRFLLPAQHFISFIIPNYYGNQATYNYWGSADYIETIGSMGSVILLFSYSSFFQKKVNNFVLLYGLTIIFCLVFTLDSPLTRFIFSLPIPILSTSIPTRIFFLSSVSFAVLAGFGLDEWIKKGFSIKKSFVVLSSYTLILAAVFIIAVIAYFHSTECNNTVILNCREIALRNTFFELFFYSIATVGLAIYTLKKSTSRYLGHLLVGIVLISTLYNAYKYIPFTSAERIMPDDPLLTYLRKQTDLSRSFGLGNTHIKTNFATYYRFYDVNYYDPLYIKEYGELINYANTGQHNTQLQRSDVEITNDLQKNTEDLFRRNRLLTLLGVKNLLYHKNESPKNITDKTILFENKNWIVIQNQTYLPKAYFVKSVEYITEENKILPLLFSQAFNPTEKALITQKPKAVVTELPKEKPKIIAYNANNVIIKTQTKNDSFLVLTDNYFPGWKVYINNRETLVYKTNHTFRGIFVPKGENTVEFVYNPTSFSNGLYISILSVVSWGLFFIFWEKISSYKKYREKS